jgi:hypothetical protein
MKKLVLLSALFALFCGQAPAQSVPALINYQGQLTDANGNALPTTDYMLTFKIYDAATGGSLIWGPQGFDGATGTTGHRGKVPVVQGYFNLMLGEVDTANRAIADSFNGTNRYVEVQVSGNNPITPRQRILTTPFAFKANSAEKLVVPGGGGNPITAVTVSASGNVGVGASSPRVGLEVLGKAYIYGDTTGLGAPSQDPALTVAGGAEYGSGRLMYLRAPWVAYHTDRYFLVGFDGNGVSKFSIRGDGMVQAPAFQGDGSLLTGVAPAVGS